MHLNYLHFYINLWKCKEHSKWHRSLENTYLWLTCIAKKYETELIEMLRLTTRGLTWPSEILRLFPLKRRSIPASPLLPPSIIYYKELWNFHCLKNGLQCSLGGGSRRLLFEKRNLKRSWTHRNKFKNPMEKQNSIYKKYTLNTYPPPQKKQLHKNSFC